MRAFIKFNKGMLKMPVHWQLWLLLLVTANLFIPLFFLARIEARIVVATFAASVTLTTALTGRYGFTRILGLGHVLWIPAGVQSPALERWRTRACRFGS